MGTLFEQSPRELETVMREDVESFLNDAKGIAEKLGCNLDQVLKAHHILQMRRRADLSVHAADRLDEQLAGFGEMLRQLIELMTEWRDDDA